MDEYLKSIKDSKTQYLKRNDHRGEILLSVVIPTYKRGKLLEDAVISIAKHITAYNKVELIIVSNDPDDDLANLCSKYEILPFSIVRNENNLGMCGNINKCLFVAEGKYIAYLHDDDMLLPDYLPCILKAINDNPNADCLIPARYLLMGDSEWGKNMQNKQLIKHVVSTLLFIKKKKEKSPYKLNVEDIYKCGRNCFSAPTCGTTFRKEAVIQSGGFPASWKYAFDFIFFEKFCRKHEVLLLKKPLGIYRMTESASNEDKVQFEFFQAQKDALDRNIDIPIVRHCYYEYLHLFAMGLSSGAQKLIDVEFGESMKKWNSVKYFFLRIRTELFYFSSGIESERYLSKNKKQTFLGGNT